MPSVPVIVKISHHPKLGITGITVGTTTCGMERLLYLNEVKQRAIRT